MFDYFEFPLDISWDKYSKEVAPRFLENINKYFIDMIKHHKQLKILFKERPFLLNKFKLLRELSKKIEFDIKKIDLKEEFKRVKAIQYDREEETSKQIAHKLIFNKLFNTKENSELLKEVHFLCIFYKNFYEAIGNIDIKHFTNKIDSNLDSIGKRIRTLLEYNKGKYSTLFLCLNNIIRNSIEHKDYEILPEKKEIIFRDIKKHKILSFNEFKKLCEEIMYLEILFNILIFEQHMNYYNNDILKQKKWIDLF